MQSNDKQKSSRTGEILGSILGAAIAVVVCFLFLRPPGEQFPFVQSRLTVIVLTIVLAVLGAWIGYMLQRFLERRR